MATAIEMLAFFFLVPSFWIIFIMTMIVGAKFSDKFHEETGDIAIAPVIGINIMMHLFNNRYKDDQSYNTLIWVLRVAIIIFIISLIPFAIEKFF